MTTVVQSFLYFLEQSCCQKFHLFTKESGTEAVGSKNLVGAGSFLTEVLPVNTQGVSVTVYFNCSITDLAQFQPSEEFGPVTALYKRLMCLFQLSP